MLKNYNKCVYCGSKKIVRQKLQSYKENFYLKAILSDLKVSLKKIKVHKCSKCFILQNNPWFDKSTSKRIYSSIYGQHHRNWSNLLNYVNHKKKPDHGELFNILNKNIKIKNYAEYNSPFMGLFINFFDKEYIQKKSLIKNFFKNIILYLTSRQLAGTSKKKIITSTNNASKYNSKLNNFRKKNKVKKFLFSDNSSLGWGQNDNYKSVNSRSVAREMFDLNEFDISDVDQKLKIDLFGIFHTLDHTFYPKKILTFALNTSKLVIVYCHVDKKLNKQHLFSLTEDFLKYLKSKKIYSIDLTNLINKKYASPELYFICSKNKVNLNVLKKNVVKKS